MDYVPGKDAYAVEQAGERRLWDEAEAAYFQWVRWGRPELARFGLTVTPDGQRPWLDSPDNRLEPIAVRPRRPQR